MFQIHARAISGTPSSPLPSLTLGDCSSQFKVSPCSTSPRWSMMYRVTLFDAFAYVKGEKMSVVREGILPLEGSFHLACYPFWNAIFGL